MSFFAGRFGDGKTVFSLNSVNGGDTGYHYSPNDNSIFHSDMPHLFVENSYTSGLGDSGYGYYTCLVPQEVLIALNADPGRVILTEYVYNNGNGERSHLLQGGSLGTGNKLYAKFGVLLPPNASSNGNGTVRIRITASKDTCIHCGYYPSGSGGDIAQQISRGTGGVYDFTGTSGGSQVGGPAPITYMAAGLGMYTNLSSTDPQVIANTWPANIDHVNSPHTFNPGFNAFFVRHSTPPRQLGDVIKGVAADPIAATGAETAFLASGQKGAGGIPFWAARSSRQDTENWYSKLQDIREGYPGWPVRVTWHITNLSYNGNGGYNIVSNPFTGSDIKISSNDFVIKGVSMMGLNRTMITQLRQNAALGWRGDTINIGANLYSPGVDGVDVPPLCASSTDGGSIGGDGGNGGTWYASAFNLTRFLPGAGWYTDSRSNSIGNRYGEVWSPNRIPLKLLPGNVVSEAIATGSITVPANGSSATLMGTWNLNMGSGNAVVCTLHFSDMTWLTCGGMTGSHPLPNSAGDNYGKDYLAFNGSSRPNNWTHQILTLPAGYHVPIYSVYSAIQANTDGVTWNLPQGVRRLTQIYYLKNLGNGQVQLYCGVYNQLNDVVRVLTPNMRITIQRLT